jgi:hypothetical protein
VGKRSSTFERRPRDFYPTPYEAVVPLLAHLEPYTQFLEPCCGDDDLVRILRDEGHRCGHASDIDPDGIDARTARFVDFAGVFGNCFITNPPWSRDDLHKIIVNLSDQLPTWLLFDADWVHTRQAAPYLPRLKRIVSVGRVKWIKDSSFTGKDNCAWHLFDKPGNAPAEFYGWAA